jgi:GNAT superfamily N-acetyltransferase
MEVVFKRAEIDAEFRQMFALNHRVFAEELRQDGIQPSRLLHDRLFHQCRYFIAIRHDVVIGMISAHAGPEFSMSQILPHWEVLGTFRRPFELRRLAIVPEERNRTILAGLFWQAYDYALSSGGSHLLIAPLVQLVPMYRKYGFTPLGPAQSKGEAWLMPMVLDIENPGPAAMSHINLLERRWNRTVRTRTT